MTKKCKWCGKPFNGELGSEAFCDYNPNKAKNIVRYFSDKGFTKLHKSSQLALNNFLPTVMLSSTVLNHIAKKRNT